MRLYFIRHGQSENNALYLRTGSDVGRVEDPQLTKIGIEQAEKTANYLATHSDPVDGTTGKSGFGITHVYSSLMHRSLATGSVLADRLGLNIVGWKDWHENGGIYLEDKQSGTLFVRPGLRPDEIVARFPRVILSEDIHRDGWWNRPFEGHDERPVRARRVLRELLSRHGGTNDRVAVVSHGGFFMHFLAAAMAVDEIVPLWFRIYNCGITRFDFEAEEQTVVYHNLTIHLNGSLIT